MGIGRKLRCLITATCGLFKLLGVKMEVNKESLIQKYSETDSDELLSLHQAGTLSDIGYIAIESVLAERKINIPTRPVQYSGLDTEDLTTKFWRGKKSLALSFWLISIIGSIFIIIIAFIISSIVPTRGAKFLVNSSITYPYFVFATVVLWRSSRNYSKWLLKFILLFILMLVLTMPVYLIAFSGLNIRP